MVLVPMPKSLKQTTSRFIISSEINCYIGSFSPKLGEVLKKDLKINKINIVDNIEISQIDFIYKKIKAQAYELKVTESKIEIFASDDHGIYYAIKTLKQALEKNYLEGMEVKDYPDLQIRGVMIDISRSKVPQLSTLKKMVDLLSDLKYNHLELYVEGFSYEYLSFKEVLSDNNYIKLDDYLQLESYANDHFIDLVPNQNGFGHMSDWLARSEYHDLAECPDGFYIWGSTRPSSTLDPTNKKSYQLVKKMYDDMIPYFKSPYFHMNFDEPFELGAGKSKTRCDETSKEDVFIEFLKPLYKVVKKYQKTPLIWGDCLINHPEALPKLPKDLVFVDWGYNLNYDFESHAKVLKDNKVKFMLAPGTCTWSTITGRYDDMIGSIKNSAEAAKKYGSEGILVTDWGDIGHLQYLPFSYPGFIFGALSSWGSPNESAISLYLDKLVGTTLSEVIIDLSKYTNLEGPYRDYGSRLFSLILWAEHAMRQNNRVEFYLEKIKSNLIDDKPLKDLENFFEKQLRKIKGIESLEKAEVENSINLLLTLVDIQKNLKKLDETDEKNIFDTDIMILKAYLKKHHELWILRNIEPGIIPSGNRIKWFIQILTEIEGGR